MNSAQHPRVGGPLLTVAALGVVFGDIGTSPLYALQTVFSAAHNAVNTSDAHVTGVISLVIWSLLIIVTLTYVVVTLRADHEGEGGVLSLATLVRRRIDPRSATRTGGTHRTSVATPRRTRWGRWAFGAGLIGCCFFFGDSVITPAISVLSAVEGMALRAPHLQPWVLPLTVGIVVVLFGVQRWGTARVGALFGPIMALWFLSLAAVGVPAILAQPRILWALSPLPGLQFAVAEPGIALVAGGGIVLVVTGAEALYADIGHFGRAPITWAWVGLVLPALALNYLGQGALILADPSAVASPFFLLAPSWAALPLTVLAIVATVIASQAVITGAYSVSRQAMRLGFLPAMSVRHTSRSASGQVYVPVVNAVLAVAVVGVVLGFGSSVALATAYGLAVTSTMVITTLLVLVYARLRWRWPWWAVAGFALVVLPLELSFLAGNAVKVAEGGWLPLAIGCTMFAVMVVWHRGRRRVNSYRQYNARDLAAVAEQVARWEEAGTITRVPSTAVYLAPTPTTAPAALISHLRSQRSVHQRVLVVHVATHHRPYLADDERLTVTPLPQLPGWTLVTLHVGFFEHVDVPARLHEHAQQLGWSARELAQASYFLSSTRYVAPAGRSWRALEAGLFVRLSALTDEPAERFALPPDHAVNVGTALRL